MDEADEKSRNERRKITTVDELPDWFKSKIYKKNLTDAQCYVEINFRTMLLAWDRLDGERDTAFARDDFDRAIKLKINPTSPLLHIPGAHNPIEDLTALEATYLAATYRAHRPSSAGLMEELNQLIALWKIEREDPPEPGMVSYRYEKAVETFFEGLRKDEKLETTYFDAGDLANPFLSYAQAINGVPLVVDTEFDDQTLIASFKKWLADVRLQSNEKIKRPFKQDDYDDWAYYKIREVYDLLLGEG